MATNGLNWTRVHRISELAHRSGGTLNVPRTPAQRIFQDAQRLRLKREAAQRRAALEAADR